MTQREGRILRQGNENKTVKIFRYITKGSFDAYSWQLLETKQRFIAALLSGSVTERSGSDIEATVLNYGEVKALAVGNPLVKKRVEAANELSRLRTLQRKAVENHIALEKELLELPGKMEHQRTLIERCRQDLIFVGKTFAVQDKEVRRQIRKELYEGVCGNVLSTRETLLMTYQGFEVLLPTNMSKEKPYVWLQRNGRYYVELGESEVGCLIRVDNVLEGFPEHLKKLKGALEEMEQRQQALQSELERKEDFTALIADCKAKIEQLDKKLGVDRK
jgi:hypothetical protein